MGRESKGILGVVLWSPLLLDLDCPKHRLAVTNDSNRNRHACRELFNQFFEGIHRINPLAVDRGKYVARLYTRKLPGT